MRPDVFDIVMLADWRQAGPIFWYQRELAEAALVAGYRLGIIQVDGRSGEARFGLHAWLRQKIGDREIAWLDPAASAKARLLIAVDGSLIERPLNTPLRLRSDINLVIETRYRMSTDRGAVDRLEMQFGGPVRLAAATDLIARQMPQARDVSIWRPAIDLDEAEARRAAPRGGETLVVGTEVSDPTEIDGRLFGWRHRALRLLGPKTALMEGRRSWPEGWQVDDGRELSLQAFCREIDAYLEGFSPGSNKDALCMGAIETAAAGGLVFASPTLASYLGGMASMTDAPSAAVDALVSDAAAMARARDQAFETLRARHSRRCHQERLADLIGPPRSAARHIAPAVDMPKRRALFFSTNGVGMGHLTRQLAIARRLPRSIEPVFLSMSQACGQVEKFGFTAEFTPYHSYYAGQVEHWNNHLTHLLHEMIAFYDPALLLFDGNHPFRALVNARDQHPGRSFVWCRRGLWQPGQNATALERAEMFDLVIEPLDLATVFDRGATKDEQDGVRCIPPIRLMDAGELDDRATAAAELGLDPSKPAVLLQLGSRNNYDLAPLVDRLMPALRAVDGLQIATVQWLISEQDHGWPKDVQVLSGYPIGRYFAAFDFSIATPGYNSFHELVAHGMPTIFIPNENPSMDDHVTRAAFAERQGFGFSLRRAEVYKAASVIDAISRPEIRATMRKASEQHACPNGAGMAAEAIEELVRSAKSMDATFSLDTHRRAVI